MNYRFVGCDTMVSRVKERLNELDAQNLDSLSVREKAEISNELGLMYVNLNAFKGHPEADELATECWRRKAEIAISSVYAEESQKERTARVIQNGIRNTPYDIPWLRQ
jgi:hypothetical protein